MEYRELILGLIKQATIIQIIKQLSYSFTRIQIVVFL